MPTCSKSRSSPQFASRTASFNNLRIFSEEPISEVQPEPIETTCDSSPTDPFPPRDPLLTPPTTLERPCPDRFRGPDVYNGARHAETRGPIKATLRNTATSPTARTAYSTTPIT